MLVFLFNDITCDELDRLNNRIDGLSDLDQVNLVALNTYSPNFSIECYDNVSRHTYKGAEAMNLYITFRKMKAAAQPKEPEPETDPEWLLTWV